jgi:GcrA cell cycle regulator
VGAIRTQSVWTKEKECLLLSLWRDKGLSISECAERFGVKRGAISGKLHRLGAKRGGTALPNRHALSRKSYQTGMRRLTFGKRAGRLPRHLRAENRRADLDTAHARVCDIAVVDTDPALHERIKLVDLKGHHCKWPLGDPRSADFAYCGRHRGDHKAYCDDHAARARRKPGEIDLEGSL